MSAVMALRERRKDSFKKEFGVGLGIASFFVKSAIAALRAFPPLNAEIQGDEIVFKHYYDIGVAVGAEGGLVVPVIRDADGLSFAQVELAIRDFAARANGGTLTLEDLRGGTFTITNGGVFGSLLSTPILNPPQVGILGLHKIQDRAVPVNGQVVIRPMMYVALSLRPPDGGRPRGGTVPREDQGFCRRSRAAPAGRIITSCAVSLSQRPSFSSPSPCGLRLLPRRRHLTCSRPARWPSPPTVTKPLPGSSRKWCSAAMALRSQPVRISSPCITRDGRARDGCSTARSCVDRRRRFRWTRS